MEALTIEPERSAAEVQIRLFGGVAAATDSGDEVDLGPAKCQAVLAVLALSPGSAVPVSRIVRLVWGETPPRTADKTLQSYVTRLRKGLGADSIARIGVAYRLDVTADSVDVVRFQRLLSRHDTDAALAEWTGTPLAGLDAEGLLATVDGLVEQYLGAVETDLGRRVEADAHAVIGSLTELTATHPFREGLWALLMTALYRVGRQADALAAYRRARQHLVEGLGVEPGPRLRELESLILGQDEQLGVDRSSRASALGLPSGTVTYGISDVEDSTRLWAAHRQEMAEAMARHDKLVTAAVDRHGGYVFATGGDSFGVAFHRASDAARWATELQAAMALERWPGGIAIQVRIGLHTGETEERGKGYFGPAVIVAARLAAAGHGGQTLLSGTASALLEGRGLRDLGTFRLDGVVAEQRIVQLGDGDHPPLQIDANRGGNLPQRLGRLIGRDNELETIHGALATSHIVTLVGPGGIGKTRLALAVAQQVDVDSRGGAWLIELAANGSSSEVPQAVASVLNVKESLGTTLTASIVAALQSRRALLVLDNCEHVIDGAANLARAIAESCPNVRVLATSREGLGLRGEQLVAVAPLDPAGSGVELFNERAAAASQTFDPDASRSDVEEICRRLDGVPLAIELAAARTRSLSPAELVERLDDRLRLLTGGRRASVERHRTLRATIQWSYDLLTPPQQAMFACLSIFAGPFDRAAAETIVDAADLDIDNADLDSNVDDLLGDLVDRSMVIVESGPFGRRFRLLETMRQFGAERLADSGNTDAIAVRHAQWCRDEVARIHELLAGSAEIEGVARLDELWPNLRAAVDWACAADDRRLARALVDPIATEIYMRSRSEIGDWAERILAITPPDDSELIVFGLTWAARRYMRNRDIAGYERLVGRYGEPDDPMIRYARGFLHDDCAVMAESAAQATVDQRLRGDHHVANVNELVAIGLTLLMSEQFEEHDALVNELVERYRVHGPPTCLQWALTQLGISASLQGRHHDAEQYYEGAAGVDVPDRTHTLKNPLQARAAFRRGDRTQAFELLRSYVEELLDNDNMYVGKFACGEFVRMMVKVDHVSEAARVVGFLESADSLDVANLRPFIAGDARTIEAGVEATIEHERSIGRTLDDRQALTFIRDVLDRLLDGNRVVS